LKKSYFPHNSNFSHSFAMRILRNFPLVVIPYALSVVCQIFAAIEVHDHIPDHYDDTDSEERQAWKAAREAELHLYEEQLTEDLLAQEARLHQYEKQAQEWYKLKELQESEDS